MKHFRLLILASLLAASSPGLAAADSRPTTPDSLRIFGTVQPPSVSAREEFFGPFANWLNARRDFGAVGNGVVDDTTALQAALDAIRPADAPPVLFIPAGTYRITRPLEVKRSGHEDSKDIMILGEDPATTIIRWDGLAAGTMLKFGAWWTRLGRLTFDGRRQAGTAITHGDLFSSINELSDLVVQDVAIGIEAGTMTGAAVAETTVLRCQFLRCTQAGISIQNWNTLDWFIWDSHFVDCRLGVANVFGAGNFHVYRSVFQRSTEADVSIGNTGYFSIRNCTSSLSGAFFKTGSSGAPALLTLEGNTILEPRTIPISIGNLGPLLLFDNVIRGGGQPAVRFEKAQAALISVGNTFSPGNPHQGTTNVLAFDNLTDGTNEVGGVIPGPSPAPSRAGGPVTEVARGATGAQIQQAMDQAASLSALNPIVHLAAGSYSIEQTLTIRAGSNVRLVGDGGKTLLRWSGQGTGTVLRVSGPTRALLRDLTLYGGGDCLVIQGCDQTRSRIFMDQVDVRHHADIGLHIAAMSRASLQFHSLYHSLSRLGVQVMGAGWGNGSDSTNARVAIFGGASSDNELCYDVSNGGQLLVQDMWYETSATDKPAFVRCTNAGNFTLHGANIAPRFSRLDAPTVLVDGFQGRLSFLATQLTFPNTRLSVRENTPALQLLLLGNLSPAPADMPTANGSVAQLANLVSTTNGGASPLPDSGIRDTTFLRAMLKLTREEKPMSPASLPPNVSDIRLHRVSSRSARIGILIRP